MDVASIPAPSLATTPLGAAAPAQAAAPVSPGAAWVAPVPAELPQAQARIASTQGATVFATELLANDAEAAAQLQAALPPRPPNGFTASLLLGGQGPGSTSAVLAGNLVSFLPARAAGLLETRDPSPARQTAPGGPAPAQAIARTSNQAGQPPDSDGTAAAYQRHGEATAPPPPPTLDILE